MLISPDYQEMNKTLHDSNDTYGTSSGKWADTVKALITKYNCKSVLDYGCGKGQLKVALGSIVQEYDPGIEGKESKQPCDLVVSTDVLEHIEPALIENVLDDIAAMTLKAAFLVIDTRRARKTLSDGRNAHLIVKSEYWWFDLLIRRFDIVKFRPLGGEFYVVVKPKSGAYVYVEYLEWCLQIIAWKAYYRLRHITH